MDKQQVVKVNVPTWNTSGLEYWGLSYDTLDNIPLLGIFFVLAFCIAVLYGIIILVDEFSNKKRFLAPLWILFIFLIMTAIFTAFADRFVDDNTPTTDEKVEALQSSVHEALGKVEWDDSEGCINSTSGYGDIEPCEEVVSSTAGSKNVITTVADDKHYDLLVDNHDTITVTEIENFAPIPEPQNKIKLNFLD